MSQYMQLGQTAIQNHKIDEAVDWFTKATQESPKNPQIKACLGQSLCWQGRRDEGITHLRQSGQLLLKKSRKTRDTSLALDLAEQLQHWNDYKGALELCKQAVQVNPDFVRGYQLLALTHSRLNQKKSALAAGQKALKLVPNSAMLAILVATLEIAEGLLVQAKQRLEKALQQKSLTLEEKFRAHKEMARLLDKLDEYDQVFAHLHSAGDISPQLPEIARQNLNLVPQMLKTNKAGFDQELLGRWAGTLFPDDQSPPVFVLGFMRTGTTLTQEVLGAHPDVFIADETDLVLASVKELARMSNHQGTLPEQLKRLDLAGVLHLRQFYWNRAHALFGEQIGKRLLLDKTTMNSIDLGFINCIFPDAKLVFLIRDPRDVCLSCIMQTMIPTPSTVHLYSWHNTAEFYAQVMDWWLTVRPRLSMDFIEFRYEDAVFQFEPAFRKVFEFMGLTWDPKVAEFHKNAAGKYIASPSFSQVAQPLYSSSVSRWRHYASEYESISTFLQPFLSEYGYD
jgi:tetratricopeptide (TPR) repeat protein